MTIAAKRPQGGLTVIVKPKDAARQIIKVNSLKVRDKLKSIECYGVLYVRPNLRLNLSALDTRNTELAKPLLSLSSIEDIAVQMYEP